MTISSPMTTRRRVRPAAAGAVLVCALGFTVAACSPAAEDPPTGDPSPSASVTSPDAAAPTLRAEPAEGVHLTSGDDHNPVDGATSFKIPRPDNIYRVTTLPVTGTTTIGDTTFDPPDTGHQVLVQVEPTGLESTSVDPTQFSVSTEGADPLHLEARVVYVVHVDGADLTSVLLDATFEGRTGQYELDGTWAGEDPEPVVFGKVLDVPLTDTHDDPLQGMLTGGVLVSSWQFDGLGWAEDGTVWAAPDYSKIDLYAPSGNYDVEDVAAEITLKTDVGDYTFEEEFNGNGFASNTPEFIAIPDTVTEVAVEVVATVETRNPWTQTTDEHTVTGATEVIAVD